MISFGSLVVMLYLLCGRRATLCRGSLHVATFISPSSRSASQYMHSSQLRLGVPIARERTTYFSSNASRNHPDLSDKTDNEYDFDRILPFREHSHNSIKITVPRDEDEQYDNNDMFNNEKFHSKLEATLATAQQLHKSAIWITVPISKATLIEHAHKCGFEFHHAEGNEATLSKWLLENEESRIPSFATHQVGVGAVVINRQTNEILCVREKRNNYRPWKMPGGLAELGEHLDEAVVREVYEETGIKCQFLSVLGVRHTHGLQFGRSDLYFVCRLEPVPDANGKVAQPVPQEGEIEAAAWVPLDEYRAMVNNPDSKIGHPMMQQIIKLADQGISNEYDIQKTIVSSVVPGRKGSPVYHAAIHSDISKETP